ncbi:MAG TPA: MlaD family protein [Burkholderiales bacterium]
MIRHLGLKVGALLVVTLLLVFAFAGYVLYARGVFEPSQRLTLVADDAEGASVGMDLTFAGFPVGRVRRIKLGEDGRARLLLDVPRRDAHWLRASSVFTLERSLVGGVRLRAHTGHLEDPPLPDGAVREVLRGDVTEEIPRMVATMRATLENVERLTAPSSPLAASFENLRVLTARLAGPQGALEGLLGSAAEARKVIVALERASALLAELGRVSRRADGLLEQSEGRLFGEGGIATEAQRAVAQATGLLGDVRERLKAVDAILVNVNALSGDARAIGGNVRAATEDLRALRDEVDASARKLGHLVDEVNRRWPFERKLDVELP